LPFNRFRTIGWNGNKRLHEKRIVQPNRNKIDKQPYRTPQETAAKKFSKQFWRVLLQALFLLPANGSVAQLNRASDYGSEGFRFES
jgi:hypothetical protein